jgi:hypothetical protein
LSRNRGPDGVMTGFSLCCAKRGNVRSTASGECSHVNQGLQLTDSGLTSCPVVIKFRWSNTHNKFRRNNRGIIMHHSHPLDNENNFSILQNRKIYDECRLYLECSLPTSQIHDLLVDKYMYKISFEQVKRLCCQIKSELRNERLPEEEMPIEETVNP